MLRRQTGRQLVSIAIVLFWAVMIALLVRRHFLVPEWHADTTENTPAVTEASDAWFGIYLPGDDRVGFINWRLGPADPEHGGGTELRVKALCKLPVFGTTPELFVEGTAWTRADGGLSSFDFSLRSAEHRMYVTGKAEAGVLALDVKTGDQTFPMKLPVGNAVMLGGNLGAGYRVPPLNVGEEVMIDTFDPTTLSTAKARVTCVARESIRVLGLPVQTRKLRVDTNGVVTTLWVMPNGTVVQAETPFGFLIKQISAEEAMEPLSGEAAQDLLDLVAIRPTGKRPFRGAQHLAITLSGLHGDLMPVTDTIQRAEGEHGLSITVPPPPAAGEDGRPYGTDLAPYLEGDPLVPTGDARVAKLAREIVGGDEDPWTQAGKVYEWVYANVAKRPVVSVPSALDVMKTREGDCNDHTVLYTALARTLGIPTRMAVGIVWSDDLNGFYYHAWPEVYMGRWIGIDPTLGQPIADATHVKFFTGGIETWSRLLPYLGAIQIDVTACD